MLLADLSESHHQQPAQPQMLLQNEATSRRGGQVISHGTPFRQPEDAASGVPVPGGRWAAIAWGAKWGGEGWCRQKVRCPISPGARFARSLWAAQRTSGDEGVQGGDRGDAAGAVTEQALF